MLTQNAAAGSGQYYEELSLPALRRHAAEGGNRHGHDLPAGASAGGRTHLGSGRDYPGPDRAPDDGAAGPVPDGHHYRNA